MARRGLTRGRPYALNGRTPFQRRPGNLRRRQAYDLHGVMRANPVPSQTATISAARSSGCARGKPLNDQSNSSGAPRRSSTEAGEIAPASVGKGARAAVRSRDDGASAGRLHATAGGDRRAEEPPTEIAEEEPAQQDSFKAQLIALIPHVRAYSRSLTRMPAADDLAQDALAKSWKSRALYQPGTNLKAWVFTIMRNAFSRTSAGPGVLRRWIQLSLRTQWSRMMIRPGVKNCSTCAMRCSCCRSNSARR